MKKTSDGRSFRLLGVVTIALIAVTAFAEMIWVTCSQCHGRKFMCSICKGTGQETCPVCKGTGMFMGWACTSCVGGKRICVWCPSAPACPKCNGGGGYWVNK